MFTPRNKNIGAAQHLFLNKTLRHYVKIKQIPDKTLRQYVKIKQTSGKTLRQYVKIKQTPGKTLRQFVNNLVHSELLK